MYGVRSIASAKLVPRFPLTGPFETRPRIPPRIPKLAPTPKISLYLMPSFGVASKRSRTLSHADRCATQTPCFPRNDRLSFDGCFLPRFGLSKPFNYSMASSRQKEAQQGILRGLCRSHPLFFRIGYRMIKSSTAAIGGYYPCRSSSMRWHALQKSSY